MSIGKFVWKLVTLFTHIANAFGAVFFIYRWWVTTSSDPFWALFGFMIHAVMVMLCVGCSLFVIYGFDE
jgi:hypothetical protein